MLTGKTMKIAAVAALAAAGLFTARAADVTLTASDTAGTTSFNAAGNWSSLAAPTAGNSYFTGAYELWTPEGGTANYTFAGDSLTVGSGGRLIYAGNGATPLPVISINNWTNSGGLVSSRTGANVLFDKPLRLAGSGNTLGAGSANTNIFAGVISGAAGGGVSIGTGSDTTLVSLTNKNTFTGGITVEAGAMLRADGVTTSGNTPVINPLGANTVTLKNGSRLQIRESGYGASTVTINYNNNVVVQGDATLDLTRYAAGKDHQLRIGSLDIGNNTLNLRSTVGGHWFAQNGDTTLSGDATFDTTINAFMGKITDGAGAYKVTKRGTGNFWLGSTASDFEGGIVLNSGSMEANANGNVFGTGAVTVNGGKLNLRYAPNAQSTPLVFNGVASLGLYHATNITYDVKSLTLNSGTFNLESSGAAGRLTLNAPITNSVIVQFTVSGTNVFAIGGPNASMTLGTNITFTPPGVGMIISAPISEREGTGACDLTKTGSGTLTLKDSTNSLTGAWVFAGGTTVVDQASVYQGYPSWSGLTIKNGALLVVKNGTTWSGRGGAVLGEGGLGRLIIDNATMTQNGGIYLGNFNSDRTGLVSVVNSGTFNARNLYMPWAGGSANPTLYGGPSRVDVSNSVFAFESIIHQFNYADSVSSEVVVTFDKAKVGAFGTSGANIDSNVTLRVRGGGVTFDLGSGTNMTVRSAFQEDPESTGGGLTLTGGGLLVLANVNATNTYSGPTTVNNGTLRLWLPNLLPAGNRLTLGSGAVAEFNGTSQTVAVVEGSGLVSSGTLTVTSEVIPGGTNTIGTLTVSGTPSLAGTLWVDVAADGSCDRLDVVGDLDVAGLALEVGDLAGLNKNKSYTIATSTGSLTGAFSTDNLPSPWLVRYDTAANQVLLVYQAGTLLTVE